MSYSDEAKLVTNEHEGVPPVGVFVTVADLEPAHGAGGEELTGFFECDAAGVRNMTAYDELWNDLGDLSAEFDVAEQLSDFVVGQQFCI